MDIIDHGRGRALQKRAPRSNAWTDTIKTAFLDTLAATCNVHHAARTVEREPSGAYSVKRRDPVFAAAWAAALEEGYQRLEAELLSSAMGADEATLAFDPTRSDAGPIDRELAIKLLARRNAAPQRGHANEQYKRVPIEDVERALLRHLDVIEKRLKRRA